MNNLFNSNMPFFLPWRFHLQENVWDRNCNWMNIHVLFICLFFVSFIYFYFIYSWLKITHFHKKNLCNNIELIDVNSDTEQETQSFPKEFPKLMWTNWQTQTHLFAHWSKKHSKELLHSWAVRFLVFTV